MGSDFWSREWPKRRRTTRWVAVWAFLLAAVGPSTASGAQHVVAEPVFGGRVFVAEEGFGHPVSLVLLHGVGPEASRIWEPWIPELSRAHHVITLDLPGFGRSDQANLLYSPERYSAFLDWLVQRYVPGPYILVGHSLGGGVALHHAATSLRGPERLVLIDAAGILHRVALTRFLAEIRAPEGLPAVGQEPFRWLNRLVGGLLDRVQEEPVSLDQILTSSLLRKVFLKGNPETIAGLALVETDFSPLVERVKAPTVLLWGDDDAVAPLRTGVLLAHMLPRAQLVTIPGGGHVPMRSRPDAFRRALGQALGADVPEAGADPSDPNGRIGRCSGQDGMRFEGVYRSIEITGCRDVVLAGVAAESIAVKDSAAELVDCRIRGGAVGLLVENSRVHATAVDVDADTALVVAGSRLDLAGVRLTGKSHGIAVTGLEPSHLLFSVSRVRGPERTEYLHGPMVLPTGTSSRGDTPAERGGGSEAIGGEGAGR